MKFRADESDWRMVAYHEAGHAVMAWRYHSWIRDRGIRISNDWTGEVHTQAIAFPFEAAWFRGTPHWDAWVYRAECEAISRLAGPVAEWKYQGRSLTRPLYTSDEANPNADLNVVGALVDAILGEPDRPHRLYQFLLQQDCGSREFVRVQNQQSSANL